LPTESGEWRVIGYRNAVDDAEHVALVHGDVEGKENVLVRMHSKCLTGDVFHSLRCDCGVQLHRAMAKIVAEGAGVIVYLDQEGRGIGLLNKIRAYALQQTGAGTVEANRLLGLPDDARDYAVAADLLGLLGVRSVRLLTNNPAKVDALQQLGITVAERVPLHTPSNPHNEGYLRTKSRRMGHYGPDDKG